ncbi:uncharacterized protein LOC110425475 [Herrania umbratica]|uniref:Uncharacterized protein LOC110425475 n=1 Tax=Herrania umbratica TaxID=108875 RepID=A0A6J1B9V0_9ROSI|nr:uncharacterized protein LOC110425475 [Herrania umbratica]
MPIFILFFTTQFSKSSNFFISASVQGLWVTKSYRCRKMRRSKAELQSKFKQYMSKPMSKAELQCKLKQYMSKPVKALNKARDFYVKSLEECASKVSYGGVIGCPASQVSRLPRSFSVNYSKPNNEEKFLNFLEVMSKKRSMESSEESNLQREVMIDPYGGLKRSYSGSIGLARIDEDKPCYFEEDALYARSRSYAYKRNYY